MVSLRISTQISMRDATTDFDFNDVGLQEETQDLHHTPPPAAVDVDQPAILQPRDGVTDCLICMCELDEPVWVCTDGTCRQPYHRECAKNSIEHDPRSANCRTAMEIQLEDDEAMVVQPVAAPRKCIICNEVITGIVLEGTQCSHTVDFECLAAYNYQFLRITRMQDFQCPLCRHPFPPPPHSQRDDGAVVQGPMSREEAGSDGDSKDNNSGDDYHGSDFVSSSESDEDYDLNEA
ncbi:hypothetical protein PHMEG_00013821 [Phytophthora megakarya]|uniref:RING-type domain-containing protein n=1 Tax=Phytophthora megakarya TaxID=4795 RepID=A0A225W5T4_9STRA|nr:hypothetical protein PHMEG_00013821 [Phytophthora megakarya]